jgi:O-antigen ligase
MAESSASEPFQLPRLSRARTRTRDTVPRWSQALAQIAFVLLVVLALAGPWMTDQADDRLKLIREAGYASVFIFSLVAIRPWQSPERLLVVPWPLLLALGWCWLSLVWAIDPEVGLRRLVLTTIVLWSLFALVREVGFERSITILRALLALLLVVNFVVALAYPTVGIHGTSEPSLTGAWRGIMEQKNWAGLACAMTILIFVFNAARVNIAARISVIAAAALFLVLTDSKTSMGVGAAALLVGGLFAWLATRGEQRQLAAPGWAWVALALLAAISFSMAVYPQAYLQLVSDPAGFTGRTQIWSALIKAYADRPLLGVGYGSLWDLGPDGPIAHYARGWILEQSQGHNGYLDLLAQIGAPGTLLVLFATLAWPFQRLLRGGDHPTRVLGAAMLVFCLGHNFTESTLFDRDALGQVFLMIAIALLWNATAIAVHGPRQNELPTSAARRGEPRPERVRRSR